MSAGTGVGLSRTSCGRGVRLILIRQGRLTESATHKQTHRDEYVVHFVTKTTICYTYFLVKYKLEDKLHQFKPTKWNLS